MVTVRFNGCNFKGVTNVIAYSSYSDNTSRVSSGGSDTNNIQEVTNSIGTTTFHHLNSGDVTGSIYSQSCSSTCTTCASKSNGIITTNKFCIVDLSSTSTTITSTTISDADTNDTIQTVLNGCKDSVSSSSCITLNSGDTETNIVVEELLIKSLSCDTILRITSNNLTNRCRQSERRCCLRIRYRVVSVCLRIQSLNVLREPFSGERRNSRTVRVINN